MPNEQPLAKIGATLDGWQDELADATRGVASGLLIGIPVVFTVDSWWLGEQVAPSDALFLLAFSYALTLVAVYWIGFRRGLRRGWQYFADALEAVALAVVTLAVIFWTLGQIGDDQAASIVVGRISVALPAVSLGIAIANHLLARDMSRLDPDAGDATAERWGILHTGWRLTLLRLAATAAGALFVSVAIVPTDELNEIATQVPVENLPIIVLLSLSVSYVVVFAAGFAGESRRRSSGGPLQDPLTETLIAYLVALGISWVVLWLFRFDPDNVPFVIYIKTVLLALPASVAAAAGRLAV